MNSKNKIFIASVFFLLMLFFISALLNRAFLFSQRISSKDNIQVLPPINTEPIVLGAATSLRGPEDGLTPSDNLIKIKEPDLTGITAKSFLVFDLQSGQNLLEQNIQDKLYIASLTKLLSALTAYQNADLNQYITISQKDVLDISPSLNLAIGDKIRALDLFNAMLIGSSNDAALALANFTQNISGIKFVDQLNQVAASLGMASSHFSNPDGFDSKNNYSTAEDLKKLITATQSLAAFKDLGRRVDYEFSGSLGRRYFTRASNKLLASHPELEAIKTGFTLGAGGAMAAKVSVFGRPIVILVLGSQNRDADTLKLKDELESSFKQN